MAFQFTPGIYTTTSGATCESPFARLAIQTDSANLDTRVRLQVFVSKAAMLAGKPAIEIEGLPQDITVPLGVNAPVTVSTNHLVDTMLRLLHIAYLRAISIEAPAFASAMQIVDLDDEPVFG